MTQVPYADRRRTAAMWCAGIGVTGITGLLALLGLIALTVDGPSSMAAILPAAGIFFTWWIWLILGIVGLTLSKDAARANVPIILSLLAIGLSLLGVVITLSMFR